MSDIDSKKNTRATSLPNQFEAAASRCPSCESQAVSISTKEDRFLYGDGAKAVELVANVPVLTCEDCHSSFVDESGMEARESAIRQHLGLLMPKDIVDLRNKHGMTQKQFAELTKIGVASLARWEAGHLMQSAAYDQYLRLLMDPANLEKLRSPSNFSGIQTAKVNVTTPKSTERKFQVLNGGLLEKKQREANVFRLCAMG